MDLSRRNFIRYGSAGLATLSMPAFLASCAKQGQPAVIAPTQALPENPFLTWFQIDEARISSVLSELLKHGGDYGDLYFQHTRATSIVLEDGVIGRANSSIEQGVGLRVVNGDQVGYAFTEVLTPAAMLEAARTASAIARGAPVQAPQQFKLHGLGQMYSLKTPWESVGIDQKLPLLRKVEAMAFAANASITKVQISYSDSSEKVMIADSAGQIVVDDRPMTRLWVNLTMEKDGDIQSNGANIAGRHGFDWYTDAQLAMLVKQAVERTEILFEARRPPAGEMPVVLAAGASGILLHEAIGHGMEADFNRKGTSIYSDLMGKKIAPDFVTIIDDGTQPGERGALNVDDEGTVGQKTVLVENGVLASYLHDRISAKHFGLKQSTGSGRRQSYKHAPMPRMRSTYMLDGPNTRDEIIASVKNGIIAETFTNGQVKIGAGDYTFFIKNGWLIEDGKVTAPIKDCNIIGNGPDTLKKVTMAANDSKLDTGGWTCGKSGQSVPVSQGLPTLLVSAMTVGGDNA